MTSSNANASASSEAQNFDSRNSIIIGHTAISKSALEADLRLLMLAFQRKQSYKFSAFADTWKEYNFSLIHFACPEKNGRENFMQALFQIVLGLPLGNATRSLLCPLPSLLHAARELGASGNSGHAVNMEIFAQCLRLLRAMEHLRYRLRLPPTQDRGRISVLRERAGSHGEWDRRGGGRREREVGPRECAMAFAWTTFSIERQLSEIEKEVMTGGLGGLNNTTILNELTDFAKRYTETKQRLVTTPQATIFARSMLAGESEEEPDPSVLTNWMVTSALNADSTESIMQIRAAVDRFKEERLQRARAGYYAGAVGLAEGPARAGELNGNRPLNERRAQIRQSDYTNRGYIPAAARATMRSLEREAHAREFSLDAAPPGFGH
ncbi:hypothetical protein BC938DRAFT_471414 [Jimgerdemannia flammicorona]|uniref:Uncharacterized protein n=1 Tax=Jimgerdemannia flammicorona TaxID=994334 RepID=A0A433Q874_9FUNG|nr:hypothetical protein BC938DRAFT_471414 [Jimgerdemannia flammicorona]